MEVSCPRQVPVRGPHGGWQQREIDLLEQTVGEAAKAGESLRSVFERVGQELGRKPNSIRNFYYAQLREREGGDAPRTLPFETFAPDEVEQLIENVLTARAQGMSVRACVRKLSDGDKTRMLRYQNKYRSTIRTRPELVQRVMQRLSEQGIPFVSPYPQETSPEQALPQIKSRVQASGDPQLTQLFDGLNHLLDLALCREAAPGDSEALRRADRLNARCDMLRIALSDEQERRKQLAGEASGMVTLIKEYIALPESDRISHTQAFCEQAAARLAAVECAMMQE